VVTPEGLHGGLEVLKDCITLLEANVRWIAVQPGEPQMGRRGLYYSPAGTADAARNVKAMMNIIAYCDGEHDVLDLCERTNLPWKSVVAILEDLRGADLIARSHHIIT
jgi:aminopeptidase-like protein